MTRTNQGNVLIRVVTGATLLALVSTLLWVEALAVGFTLFIALLAVVGLHEYQSFAQRGSSKAEQFGAAALVLAMMVCAHYGGLRALNTCLLLAVLAVATLHLFTGARTIAGLCSAVFGIVYLGWLPAHFVLLRNFGSPLDSPALVLFLIILIAVSDISAYAIGKNFGRHKLAPAISPKKTWEGAAGGVLGAVVVSIALIVCYERVTKDPGTLTYATNIQGTYNVIEISPLWIVLPAIILSIAGQIGDLVESMLKRDAGVKDSGNFLPGHGGVLDRCDGFLFAGPLWYHLVAWYPVTAAL